LFQGDIEKFHPWNFSRRNSIIAMIEFIHFHVFTVHENGGASLPRTGTLNFSRYP